MQRNGRYVGLALGKWLIEGRLRRRAAEVLGRGLGQQEQSVAE